jgi:hypothetical protein
MDPHAIGTSFCNLPRAGIAKVWSANLFDASVPEAFGATRASQRLHRTIKEAQREAQLWVGNDPITWQPLVENVSIGLTADGPHSVVIGEHLPSEEIPESKFVWIAILWYPAFRERWQDGIPLNAVELDRLREHGVIWQIRRHQWEIISGHRATSKVKVSQRLHWLLEDAQECDTVEGSFAVNGVEPRRFVCLTIYFDDLH